MGGSNSLAKFLVQYRDNVTNRAGKFSLKTSNFYELYTYIYGEGPFFYFVNDKIYSIEPGSVLLLRPGVLIGSCKKNKVRYTRLVCRIPIYMAEFINKLDPSLFSFLSRDDIGIFNLEGAEREEYFSCVEEMKVLAACKDNVSEALMFSLLLKMVIILNRACPPDTSKYVPASSDELIVRIIEKINEEYASLSTVAELARKINYSKNYVSQYFKSRMNMGLHDFLIMKKLSAAQAKLISGKSITDVAFECGFGSTAYFISIFKARYGTTPGKYISENR